jgi:hypothetical protein
MSENRINVIGPDGQSGSIPSDQIDNAIRQGYKVESPEQKEINDAVDAEKGLVGAAKVALLQGADEALFGIPEVVAAKKMDPLEMAKWEAIKKDHGLANALGGGAGFLANFAVGGPIFKAAAKAGLIAEKGAASLLAKSGIAAGEAAAEAGFGTAAKQAAKNIVEKTITKTAQLGTEGAIIGLPMASTEAMLGDTDLAAETLMWSAGLGGGLGALFGGGTTAVKDIVKLGGKVKAGKSAAKISDMTAKEIIETMPRVEAQAALAQKLEEGANDPNIIEHLFNETKKEIPGAEKYREIMARQGLEEVPGALSASPTVRGAITALEASPTFFGSKAYQKIEEARQKVQDVLAKKVLKVDPTNLSELSVSKRVVGEELSQSFMQKLGDMAESFTKKYAPLEEKAVTLPVDEESLLRVYEEASKLKNPASNLLAGVSKKAEQAVDDALSARTVKDLSKVRTAIGNEIKMASRAGDSNMIEALNPIYNGLTAAREAALEKAGLAGAYKPVDVEYRQFKSFLKEFAGESKLGRMDSRAKIVEKLGNISGEQMVQKILNPNNARATEFFATHFPEEFQKAAQFLKTELAQNYNKAGKLQVGQVVRNLEKFDSSIAEKLFGKEGAEALSDVSQLYDVIPKFMEHNPSGTSRGLMLNDVLSPAKNTTDAITYGLLFKGDLQGSLRMAEKSMKKAAEALDEIPTIISRASTTTERARDPYLKPKSFSKPTQPVVSQRYLKSKDMTSDDIRQGLLMSAISRLSGEKIRNKKERDELKDLIVESMAEPDKFQEKLDPFFEAISDTGAPETSKAMRVKAATAMKYLFDSLPKAGQPRDMTGNTEHRPSDYEISKFNRKLEAVIDPLVVLNKLKSGNLTKDHADALRTVYPKLYSTMTQRIMNHLATDKPKLSYQAKSQLSTLLGFPVDSTMKPDGILRLQQTFDGEQKPPQNGIKINTKAADREKLR